MSNMDWSDRLLFVVLLAGGILWMPSDPFKSSTDLVLALLVYRTSQRRVA